MTTRKLSLLGALLVGAALLGTQPAAAEYVLVTDFDDLDHGCIDEQGGWIASDVSSCVAADPEDPANSVLSILSDSAYLYVDAEVPEGAKRMLFLRFRYENNVKASFGMTDTESPDMYKNFKPEIGFTGTSNVLRVNSDGSYEELQTIKPGVWYNCWLLIDNAHDATSVWLHCEPGQPALDEDRVRDQWRQEYPFRQTCTRDLRNFFIKTGGGNGMAGGLILDDIYLQDTDGLDLSNPLAVTPVTTAAVKTLSLAGASPNPFNPRTTLAFSLLEAQSVDLSIYDLAGRRVRRLVTGPLEAGPHAVMWDGRDGRGVSVASGVYLVRLAGRRESLLEKLVLTR